MSNMRFTIDAIPTPKLNFANAFKEDLDYYVENKKMPPLGRSALAREQENLNNYLKYVNENFIQEGFSSSGESVSTAFDTPVAQWANNGSVTFTESLATTAALNIAPEEDANLQLHWVICGEHTPAIIAGTDASGNATTTTQNGTLTVELWLDTVKQREWQQVLQAGRNVVCASVCYNNRAAGTHLVQLKVKCSAGTFAVATGDHYAWGYGQIIRR